MGESRTGEYGIGQSVPRSEDARLVRGRGRFTDDIVLPRQAVLYVLRSPHAAAQIRAIDTSAATAASGVLAVLTGEHAEADGLGTFTSGAKLRRPDGQPNLAPPFRVLALGRVRYVGDPVVAIVAENLAAAKDAADLVLIDYEPLPSVTATDAAIRRGAPPVWDEAPDNVCFVHEVGDKAAVDIAFAGAKQVTRLNFTVTRVSANPMEMRNAIGVYDEHDERYTLYVGSQSPHNLRSELAGAVLKIAPDRLRIVSPDVGGGFGMKGGAYPEWALVLWASRKIGRPVRWQAERNESFLSDFHARDNVSTVELALDPNGTFLGLRLATTGNLGAYLSASGPLCLINNLGGLAGPYRTPHIYAAVTGVFTNTNPTAAYRGAGRPEASYAVERVIDQAAREMGLDRAELRRRNLIPPDAMPFKTGLVYTYDSGAFETNMDMALALANWVGFEARRTAARRQGKLRGIGLAYAVEIAGGPAHQPLEEGAEIRFDGAGDALILVGSHSHGQGHETTFAQVATHLLGISPKRIRISYGDTDQVYHGRGTFGSRSAAAVATALAHAARKLLDKARLIAAHLLEAAPVDLEFADGRFAVAGTDRSVDLCEVARASFVRELVPSGMELGLAGMAITAPKAATFPNGCHIAELEIDEETGAVAVTDYWVVDDVGRVINPLIVEGQIHGGVAQGIGQALLEQVVYDQESGQLLSGSFMDYCMPRAADIPPIEARNNEVPTPANPLGVKGVGEAGTVGALPAVMNAVLDALAPLGITRFDMPATPERVWRAMQAAMSSPLEDAS